MSRFEKSPERRPNGEVDLILLAGTLLLGVGGLKVGFDGIDNGDQAALIKDSAAAMTAGAQTVSGIVAGVIGAVSFALAEAKANGDIGEKSRVSRRKKERREH